ncbi:MAG TPA: DUF1573 domain-containing protein [Saprospiraceae bacterium]|nr:DUF1573 domain-containing protein [Saprospiraceae bacterium]
MKHLLSILVFLLVGIYATAQTAPAVTPVTKEGPAKGPKMVFENNTVDYGEIKKGSDRVRKAEFVNKGTEPLVIKNARGSCGCTVPTWPKDPIMPGEKGVIEINYDTQRVGPINKTVRIQTNEGEEEYTLYIKGNISAEEEQTLPKQDGNILNPKG